MRRNLSAIAIECLADLGVTLIYAVVVGVAIACIAVSDGGAISFLRAGLYALALPVGVAALIATEIGLRLFREWRQDPRGQTAPSAAQARGA